jgi:hypothetical protein
VMLSAPIIASALRLFVLYTYIITALAEDVKSLLNIFLAT